MWTQEELRKALDEVPVPRLFDVLVLAYGAAPEHLRRKMEQWLEDRKVSA